MNKTSRDLAFAQFPALAKGYTFFPRLATDNIFPRLRRVPQFSPLGVALGNEFRRCMYGPSLLVTPGLEYLVFSNHNNSPENDVILVRDVVIPYLFVCKMTVDSFPSRVGQGLRGTNHT